MKTVVLGKTGLEISRIGMGGIPIQRPPSKEAVKVIQHALDLGITFIDTALGYGDSEKRIGKAVAGRRDEIIIATKGGWRDKKMAAKHIEWSLKRLNTDYIDLWQFHGVNTLEIYEKVARSGSALEGVQDALQAGKIRHIGLTSHNIEVAARAVASGLFETIQFPLNFVSHEAADELVPLAREHDVGFIAMKPFAGGNIRDANLAIKYLLQFDNVVPDPGIEKVEEIEEIVDIINGSWELSLEDRQKMEDICTELDTRFCRQCMYCMPCPQGVDIRMLMYIRTLWKLWPPDKFFSWLKKVVESAENCIQCGECEEKCPYNLSIREMMDENVEFYQQKRNRSNP